MRKKTDLYQRNPNIFYYSKDESSNASVTKSDDFDPTPIANSEGIHPLHMPLKEVEFVMDEGSVEYYRLSPEDKQGQFKKESKTAEALSGCSDFDADTGFGTDCPSLGGIYNARIRELPIIWTYRGQFLTITRICFLLHWNAQER